MTRLNLGADVSPLQTQIMLQIAKNSAGSLDQEASAIPASGSPFPPVQSSPPANLSADPKPSDTLPAPALSLLALKAPNPMGGSVVADNPALQSLSLATASSSLSNALALTLAAVTSGGAQKPPLSISKSAQAFAPSEPDRRSSPVQSLVSLQPANNRVNLNAALTEGTALPVTIAGGPALVAGVSLPPGIDLGTLAQIAGDISTGLIPLNTGLSQSVPLTGTLPALLAAGAAPLAGTTLASANDLVMSGQAVERNAADRTAEGDSLNGKTAAAPSASHSATEEFHKAQNTGDDGADLDLGLSTPGDATGSAPAGPPADGSLASPSSHIDFDMLANSLGVAASPPGERSGILASFILNASMIPGWPPPRQLEAAGEKALSRQSASAALQMDEAESMTYLANLGANEALLTRLRELLGKPGIPKKVIFYLAILFTALTVVIDSLKNTSEAVTLQLKQDRGDGNESDSSAGVKSLKKRLRLRLK